MAQLIGVREYFAGKSVFVTGGTGFMGRVLVEKLLRSCPDLKTLYLLMRSKKGLSVDERLQSYVNDEVFGRIQAECPKNLHKIRLVSGDVVADELGISIPDQEELQREVQIVFHCAASVRLIHPLPNTYSYTKALTEDLVADFAGKFPIAIARPSIVIAAHQEPIPGWVNNLNGPTGILVAVAKGVHRIMHTYKNIQPDFISVDVAINVSIMLAAATGIER